MFVCLHGTRRWLIIAEDLRKVVLYLILIYVVKIYGDCILRLLLIEYIMILSLRNVFNFNFFEIGWNMWKFFFVLYELIIVIKRACVSNWWMESSFLVRTFIIFLSSHELLWSLHVFEMASQLLHLILYWCFLHYGNSLNFGIFRLQYWIQIFIF